jgi:hypothetical protein
MANNLPSVYRFSYEDYNTMPAQFKDFLNTLNLFTVPIYTMANGDITFSNLQRIPYSFTITAGSGNNTFTLVNPLSISPNGVTICKIQQQANVFTPITNAVSCANWNYDGKNITLYIVGLTSSETYDITVEVF